MTSPHAAQLHALAASCDRKVRTIDERIDLIDTEILVLAERVRALRRERYTLVCDAETAREAARTVNEGERVERRRPTA